MTTVHFLSNQQQAGSGGLLTLAVDAPPPPVLEILPQLIPDDFAIVICYVSDVLKLVLLTRTW